MHEDTTTDIPVQGTPLKTAPEDLTLRAQPRPVTRLNRRMLAALTGSLSIAVLGALVWSLQPQRRNASEATELYNVDRVSRSEGLDRLPADYSQLKPEAPPPVPSSVPELGPPLPGDLGVPILRAQQEAQSYGAPPPPHDPAEAARLARLKEAEEAAASSVFFRTAGPKTAAATPAQSVPTALTPPMAWDSMPAVTGPTTTHPVDAAAVQNRQDQKEAFLSKTGSTQTHNSGSLQLPVSPYQVMAGTVISGALLTGIQSDLPGDVIATVTEPVYDSATGQYLLIPQGARLLGKYNSQVSYGQRRTQVVWNRVILPDTSSFLLDNLVGTDAAGYAGLEDGVDWHWQRLLAGAVMTTLLGIGAELAASDNRQDGHRANSAGRDGLQDAANQVGQQMTRHTMNIQPTLTSRPGLPVRVIINRDLVLRPYQPMFFQRGASR